MRICKGLLGIHSFATSASCQLAAWHSVAQSAAYEIQYRMTKYKQNVDINFKFFIFVECRG